MVRLTELESSALGVAQVAGMRVDLWKQEDLATQWTPDRAFEPSMSDEVREELHSAWLDAVRYVIGVVPSFMERVSS